MTRHTLNGFAVALILAVYPSSNDPSGDVKYLLTGLAASVLLIAWVWKNWRIDHRVIVHASCLPILVTWLLVSLAATATSTNPGIGIVMCVRMLALISIYWVTAQAVRTPQHATTLMRWICIATGIASVYGICQYLGWDPLPWDEAQQKLEEYRNAPATFGNPNLAGHVLVLAFVLLVFAGTQRGNRWMLAIAPVLVAHHAITHHRAGYIALLGAALVVVAVLSIARQRRNTALPARSNFRVAALVAGGAVAVFCLVAIAFSTRITDRLPLDLSSFLRLNSLSNASRMVAAAPWLGWGPGNYQIENVRFWSAFEQDWYATERRLNTHVHNDILETATECGMIGAACHIAVLIFALWKCVKAYSTAHLPLHRRLALALLAAITAFAADGLLGFNLRAPASAGLFFVMLGVCDGVFSRPPVESRYHVLGVLCAGRWCSPRCCCARRSSSKLPRLPRKRFFFVAGVPCIGRTTPLQTACWRGPVLLRPGIGRFRTNAA